VSFNGHKCYIIDVRTRKYIFKLDLEFQNNKLCVGDRSGGMLAREPS